MRTSARVADGRVEAAAARFGPLVHRIAGALLVQLDVTRDATHWMGDAAGPPTPGIECGAQVLRGDFPVREWREVAWRGMPCL